MALDAKGNLYITDNENFVIRQVADPALSVKQVRVVQEPVILYPDPATESITVQVPQGVYDGKFTICNATGQAVKQVTVRSASVNVDVSGLAVGVYFVSYGTAAYKWNGKFVKQ